MEHPRPFHPELRRVDAPYGVAILYQDCILLKLRQGEGFETCWATLDQMLAYEVEKWDQSWGFLREWLTDRIPGPRNDVLSELREMLLTRKETLLVRGLAAGR